jgi:hypothetical protein
VQLSTTLDLGGGIDSSSAFLRRAHFSAATFVGTVLMYLFLACQIWHDQVLPRFVMFASHGPRDVKNAITAAGAAMRYGWIIQRQC